MAPTSASTAQNRATTTKPSRTLSSWRFRRTGYQNSAPATKTAASVIVKSAQLGSFSHRAIASGGNMVALATISSRPRMRWIVAKCTAASEEGYADLEQSFHGGNMLLVHQKQDDMIIAFNNRIVV